MLRFCLLLGLAAPVWATPITGVFDISADSNFADILGDGFAWQFHQGNAGPIFTICPGNNCSLDGSAAPAALALLNSNNWFRAASGSGEASGNLTPGQIVGSIGGSFSWHVSRTNWSDVPVGTPVAVMVPMEVSGKLTAADSQGNPFLQATLSGAGDFETTVLRTDAGVTFFGAAGRFDGTVSDQGSDPVPSGAGSSGADPVGNGATSGGPAGSASGAASGGESGGASDPTPVPEPATCLLFGLGLASLTAFRRRFA
jgi:hypothetical protein